MKTAISILGEVFEAVDRAVKTLGVTRSELYATVVSEYVKRHRIEDTPTKLNEVYISNVPNIDSNMQNMQLNVLSKEDW